MVLFLNNRVGFEHNNVADHSMMPTLTTLLNIYPRLYSLQENFLNFSIEREKSTVTYQGVNRASLFQHISICELSIITTIRSEGGSHQLHALFSYANSHPLDNSGA